MNILNITVALLLGVAIMVAFRHYSIACNLRRKVERLNKSILQLEKNSKRAADEFHNDITEIPLLKGSWEYVSYPRFGYQIVVARRILIGSKFFNVPIKVYDDFDLEFNKREAEDLIEKLCSE